MTGGAEVRVGVLGPLEVVVHGRRRELGSAKQRLVLAMLVLARGSPVAADTLAEELWGAAGRRCAQQPAEPDLPAAPGGGAGGDHRSRWRLSPRPRLPLPGRDPFRRAGRGGRDGRSGRPPQRGARALARAGAGRVVIAPVRQGRGSTVERGSQGRDRGAGRRAPGGRESRRGRICWSVWSGRSRSARTRGGGSCSRCTAAAGKPTRWPPTGGCAARCSRNWAWNPASPCALKNARGSEVEVDRVIQNAPRDRELAHAECPTAATARVPAPVEGVGR